MSEEPKDDNKSTITSLINMKSWNLTLKEVILILIAGLLLLLVLVFAGLYGRTESQLDCWTNTDASAVMDSHYCTSPGCLKTADYMLQLMNKSVDPCDNFYEYACGNYKISKPIFVGPGPRSVLEDIRKENEDRLITILERPVSQNDNESYEYKLKQFFLSCNTVELRERNRGTPFLTKVVSALGGWKVLGTWDRNWDFNTSLKKVHADFAVDALYQVLVWSDESDNNNYHIAIKPTWSRKNLHLYYLVYHMYYRKEINDYKTFIRRVGSLLIGDAIDAPLKNERQQKLYLDEFVNDTFSVEHSIANIMYNLRTESYDNTADYSENKVTLANLITETNNVINWTDQMSYIFNESSVDGSTEVIVINRQYIHNLTAMIASLPDDKRNRILHNYLIWRVAEKYIQGLSWEYIHANREFTNDIYGQLDLKPLYRNCFSVIADFMPYALGSLLVAEHFTDENKKTITEIFDIIRLTLKKDIDKSPRFDHQTKTYAKKKIDIIKLKFGLPDWIANQTYVDAIYSQFTINVSDFFGTMLNINQLKRTLLNKQLLKRHEITEEWNTRIYDIMINYSFLKSEIRVQEGLFQPPVYHKDQPQYATFGFLGSTFGLYISIFVNARGQYINQQGRSMFPSSWWSNSSKEAYKLIVECVSMNSDIKEMMVAKSSTYKPEINYLTRQVVSMNTALRVAVAAYNNWLHSHHLLEKPLPGVDMTNEQMIYLAFAHRWCNDNTFYVGNEWDLANEDKLNFALGQLREFSDAFKCKSESKMNYQKKCDDN